MSGYNPESINVPNYSGAAITTGYCQPVNEAVCPHCGKCRHCGQPSVQPQNPYQYPLGNPLYGGSPSSGIIAGLKNLQQQMATAEDTQYNKEK